MRLASVGFSPQPQEGEKRVLNSELWHACAGPLVSLPAVGSRVVYFPQGHSEQVAASTNKEVDSHIPNYPSLTPQLICQLHNLTMHADIETDEVYAQMTLQPLSPQEQKEGYLPAELGNPSKQPTNYFCKTLTASDTSTHGGFSVPRRAAEKVFPPLDFTQQPPAQELIARDLHDNEWKFRHIFRGQPKRHLLTTGWSVFVSAKRLVAGDSVLFIWNEKNQLLLGIRRANRPQTVMPSSVLSSDSMHLGLLAAAAHAAATSSRFTIFYNPRASPSEFVIPLAKYVKAVYHTRVSVGMRFRMLFETEESSVRRYMGTITGISDLDPSRWTNSHWRSVKVGWDESTAGDRQPRVSLWEIEPLTTFPMYPSPFPLRLKRPWPPGLPAFHGMKEDDFGMNSQMMWIRGDYGERGGMQAMNFQSPWMQQQQQLGMQPEMYQAMAALQDMRSSSVDPSKPIPTASLLQFQNPNRQASLMHSQQAFLQGPESSPMTQHHHSFNHHHQMPDPVSPMSHFSSQSPSALQPISPMCQQQQQHHQNQSFQDSNGMVVSPLHGMMGSFPAEDHLLNLQRSGGSMSAAVWPSKRAAVEPPPPPPPASSVSLPPFPGRECGIDPDGNGDPGSNLLFGVNIDPSSLDLMQHQNGMSTQRDPVPFPSSSYMNTPGSDFSLNPAAIDESEFLHSPDDGGGQGNNHNRTFVKVYKSGSFGRSLDITKFSSYHELRGELARMFGLEGELEDPLRSGWQLVFVDRENDVLLLGDDPWPEFVNSVWCIKILSPQEVQQMGKRGLELLNSVSLQRLAANNTCEDNFPTRQDSRNLSSGITSVGSLEY